MPRVLRIINRFNLGGITYNVSFLSRYLPKEYETLLIGGPEEDQEQSSLYIPESLGLQPILVKEMRRSLNPINDVRAFFKIRSIVKEFDPEIVHTHASKAGAIGRLAALSCGVPVIVHTFHGHVFEGYFGKTKTDVFKRIERYLCSKSTAVVAISEKQKFELCEVHHICDPAKTFVIPLGFDLHKFQEGQRGKRSAFREKYALDEDELAIVIIGRLAPIKNHKLFLDAVEHAFKNTKKKIRAFIIGDGETKEDLIAYCKNKQLPYSFTAGEKVLITFTGWIKEADVALAGSDLVCLTSLNEGTPVSLIEAQAASKYIISTNVGGINDILDPACGLLSEPGDTAGFERNLVYAISHFEEVTAKAGAAAQKVLQHFSYARLCKDMDELYVSLKKK
ncbi:MAG: glycosyltransferase [bacterium]|nr:glycosyltransferase [bacterium]